MIIDAMEGKEREGKGKERKGNIRGEWGWGRGCSCDGQTVKGRSKRKKERDKELASSRTLAWLGGGDRYKHPYLSSST